MTFAVTTIYSNPFFAKIFLPKILNPQNLETGDPLETDDLVPLEDSAELRIRNGILFSAISAEQGRLDRKKGIVPDGSNTTDPTYLHLKAIKKGWLDQLGLYEKDKTPENFQKLKEEKRNGERL